MDNCDTPIKRFVPYPVALRQLRDRLGATPDELAAWVFFGRRDGGLAAFEHANELDPPPRFAFQAFAGMPDVDGYLPLLMGTWFDADELAAFEPRERFITGAALIERWGRIPGIVPVDYMKAKIRESRLSDMHPVLGLTQGSGEGAEFPAIDEALFSLAEIEAIERDELAGLKDADHVDANTKAALTSPAELTAASMSTRSGVSIGGSAPGPGAKASTAEQARRAARRKRELRQAGKRNFLQVIARELECSTKWASELIKRGEKPSPFPD